MGRIFAIACGCKMRMDGLQKVIRAPVVEEESALAHSPQRRAAEHIPCRSALRDVISEAFAHMVYQQVRIGMRRQIL